MQRCEMHLLPTPNLNLFAREIAKLFIGAIFFERPLSRAVPFSSKRTHARRQMGVLKCRQAGRADQAGLLFVALASQRSEPYPRELAVASLVVGTARSGRGAAGHKNSLASYLASQLELPNYHSYMSYRMQPSVTSNAAKFFITTKNMHNDTSIDIPS